MVSASDAASTLRNGTKVPFRPNASQRGSCHSTVAGTEASAGTATVADSSVLVSSSLLDKEESALLRDVVGAGVQCVHSPRVPAAALAERTAGVSMRATRVDRRRERHTAETLYTPLNKRSQRAAQETAI